MKRSRFDDEQIVAILKEQEAGMATAEVCRLHGIGSATSCKLKAKSGGRDVSDDGALRQGLREPAAERRRFGYRRLGNLLAREGMALVADTSLSGARVARELTGLMGSRGKPHTVVSDNGTELTPSAILRWSQERRGVGSSGTASRPARLPNPKPTTINPRDSRYERGTGRGQVS